MARMGMDVDQVESASAELKREAGDINSLIAAIDRTVSNLTNIWDGADAQKFVHEWWPEHKKALSVAATAIEGLGTSAHNNAQEQRTVSGR